MTLFVRIGGILIVLLGIYQLGFIKINFYNELSVFSLKTDNKMNVMVAFIMDLHLVLLGLHVLGQRCHQSYF